MPTFSYSAAFGRSLASKPLEIPGTKSNPEKDESKQLKETTFTCLRPRMSPSLYATPNEIQLPSTQSSFPPSPYMVTNHKARAPAPTKSASEVVDDDASSHPKTLNEERVFGSVNAILDDNSNGARSQVIFEHPVWDCSPPRTNIWKENPGKDICSNTADEWGSYLLDSVRIKADKEPFFNRGESFSFRTHTEIEEDESSSHRLATPSGEFYDACDELSSSYTSVNSVETELREMRLSLLMEVEKRKKAEETLEKMHLHWRRLRLQLADAGVFLPLDPTTSQYIMNVADELRCQLEVTRFVSDSLGSSLANAEAVMEMESELEAKKFEITRLSERVRYYETVNKEMCQRNQEATIEAERREEQKRERIMSWIWGSISATIILGVSLPVIVSLGSDVRLILRTFE